MMMFDGWYNYKSHITVSHNFRFSFAQAAEAGVKKALGIGSKAPMLFFNVKRFAQAGLVAVLGAMKALYVPLEVREQVPEKALKADRLGVFGDPKMIDSKMSLAKALEMGRIVSRDIGGSDPERMAAPRVEEYVRDTFEDTDIKVNVVKGQTLLEKEYPCFAAVNRAASGVARHDGRVIWLTYEPSGGKVEKTVMLVGKGVTYDTGGADIKAGGYYHFLLRENHFLYCAAND